MSEIWNLSTLCRCCHTDGNFKSLREAYTVEGSTEIYEYMLRDVFSIAIFQITTPSFIASYAICDRCISSLRDAARFKKQVLDCEEKFHVYCKNEQSFMSPVEAVVKIEEIDSETYFEDDEQFSAPAEPVLKIEYIKNNEAYLNDPPIKLTSQVIEIKKENKVKINIKEKGYGKDIGRKKEKAHVDGYSIIEKKSLSVKRGKRYTYTCKFCNLHYSNESSIKKHIYDEHKDVITYKCQDCLKLYLSKIAFERHIKLHSKLFERKLRSKFKFYICDLCKKQIRHRSTLIKHFKWHEGTNRSVLCDQCGRGFCDSTNLQAHIRTVHERLRPFKCDVCGADFSSKKCMKRHIMIQHMKIKSTRLYYHCNLCPKKYKWAKTLRLHQLRHENKYQCRVCNKIFDDLYSYKSHVHKPSEKKYICNICDKEFSALFTLKRHIDAHNDVRRFHCEMCTLKFIDKQQLKRHKDRVHNPSNANDRVQCLTCKRRVKDITKHISIAHEFKKYSCTLCGNSYVQNRSLRRHILVMHSGTVCCCDVCRRNFISLKSLERHKRKVHKSLKSDADDQVLKDTAEERY